MKNFTTVVHDSVKQFIKFTKPTLWIGVRHHHRQSLSRSFYNSCFQDPNLQFLCRGSLSDYAACQCKEDEGEVACINAQFVDTEVFFNLNAHYRCAIIAMHTYLYLFIYLLHYRECGHKASKHNTNAERVENRVKTVIRIV